MITWNYWSRLTGKTTEAVKTIRDSEYMVRVLLCPSPEVYKQNSLDLGTGDRLCNSSYPFESYVGKSDIELSDYLLDHIHIISTEKTLLSFLKLYDYFQQQCANNNYTDFFTPISFVVDDYQGTFNAGVINNLLQYSEHIHIFGTYPDLTIEDLFEVLPNHLDVLINKNVENFEQLQRRKRIEELEQKVIKIQSEIDIKMSEATALKDQIRALELEGAFKD